MLLDPIGHGATMLDLDRLDGTEVGVFATHDADTVGSDGEYIWGIQHRVLHILLYRLSQAKGNNIVRYCSGWRPIHNLLDHIFRLLLWTLPTLEATLEWILTFCLVLAAMTKWPGK